MKKVEYFCNLCGEKKEPKELQTLVFKCDIIPQRYVILKDSVNQSDKHICNNCVSLIKES